MKGVSTPLSTAVILPSPILLWRFKVLLFFIWGFGCSKIGWDSVMRMSVDLRDLFLYEAFLYYNPLLLVTMMVWLWGVNLWVFALASVPYSKIFDLDQNHLTHREIWKCATWMTIVVPTSMTAYLYLYSHGEVLLAAFQPVLLYAAVATVLLFPFDIFYLSSRYFLLRTLWRIVFPLQAISFADFFLADILTSMAKVCIPWSMSLLSKSLLIAYSDLILTILSITEMDGNVVRAFCHILVVNGIILVPKNQRN
ncbi:hypothetical protein CsSME_00017939 [Camellia sinensis var. sinensis]